MPLITLANDSLHLVVSTRGGSILQLHSKITGQSIPILRDSVLSENTPPLASGCFPLAPFGNRVRDNVFSFAGDRYTLTPNVPWDPHYLHGDAWLNEWEVVEQSAHALLLRYTHSKSANPYAYVAEQRFELRATQLTVTLSVRNLGEKTLPFGLGWHPYFVMDRSTTLEAAAAGYWTEGEHWLPDQFGKTPPELDFSKPRVLPRHWVNNGFSGWTGQARITWPSRRLAVTLQAPCAYYFVFVSETNFDPSYQHDFFCFEPMSHAADAHNTADGAGLVVLAPQATTAISLSLRVEKEPG